MLHFIDGHYTSSVDPTLYKWTLLFRGTLFLIDGLVKEINILQRF